MQFAPGRAAPPASVSLVAAHHGQGSGNTHLHVNGLALFTNTGRIPLLSAGSCPPPNNSCPSSESEAWAPLGPVRAQNPLMKFHSFLASFSKLLGKIYKRKK